MSLHERQLKIEEDMVSLGRDRYEKAIESQGIAASSPGLTLIAKNLRQVSARLQENIDWFTGGPSGRAGRYAKTVLKLLTACDASATAYIALRRAIQGAGASNGNGEPLSTVAASIGTLVEEHIAFEVFRGQEAKLANWWAQRAKETNHEQHARKVMRAGARGNGAEFDWTEEDRLKVGMWLIEHLEDCGLVARKMEIHKRKTRALLVLSEPVAEFFRTAHEATILAAPFNLPMVHRPVDWTTPFDGGYLTKRNRLVTGRIPRGWLDDLASTDLRMVYDALNAVQSTRWQVNTAVLSVLETLYASPAGAPGVPGEDEEPLPVRPEGIPENVKISALPKLQQEVLAYYRRQCKEVYDHRAAAMSKRVSFASTLYVARRFASEEVIYFPHVVDSRGRIYSIPSGLSPQGTDIAKGLLRFADGKPLGENGHYWLAVHLANCFGVDKVTFEERVEWALDNHQMLMQIALAPLDNVNLWAAADSPWQFLAACFEWAGAAMAEDPSTFVSHIPVGMDGSCSGLQHFSAALRDAQGGESVNLRNTGKVEDIYQRVADKVNARLNSSTCEEDLLPWRGYVDRKIVKQCCMTYAYSSTLVGNRNMILAALAKKDTHERPVGDQFQLAVALAPAVREAIEQTVIAAADAMSWLQQVAAIATDEGRDLRWTTPSGFTVLQRKTTFATKQVTVWYGGKQLRPGLSYATKKLSKVAQKNGVAPNWVHSMDAAHLVDVVLTSLANDMTSFAMVHDSFGVHACDVDKLNRIIRLTFVDMYAPNRLEEFRTQVQAQLATELPPVPPMGTLDLAEVLESDYFFA